MMVPARRLTPVRSFPTAQLVRAMTFVAIPSLIGPMLGPVACGLIVSALPFNGLKSDDGSSVSQRRVEVPTN